MFKSIGVHIKASNFTKSRDFYQGLGFTLVFEYGPDKEVKEDYSGATFALGEAKIEVADGHRAVKPEIFNEKVTSPKISLMIEVDSIGEIMERANKMGLRPTTPVRHYYWGKLEVVYKDPDGVVVVFTEPYSQAKAKEYGADEKFGVAPIKSN